MRYSMKAAIAAAMAIGMQVAEFAKRADVQIVSKGKGRGASAKNEMKPYPTNWKGKLKGKTCGKRQQERMARQLAAGWHKPHPMAVKLAAERQAANGQL